MWNQKSLICVFLGWNLKRTLSLWNQHLQQKCLNFGPKILDLGIFRLKFENNVLIFEICTLKFDYFLNFTLKQKGLNFRPKMPDLGLFCAGIWKRYGHILNQHSRNCLIAKFYKKTMPKFGTKCVLFGYFWAGILEISTVQFV